MGGGLLRGGEEVALVIVDPHSGEVARVVDRRPGGLEDGARVLGRLRAQAQRPLRLPAALRDLPARPGRLAALAPGRQPRPAGPARLRRLPLLLQPGRDRGLGAAAVPGAALPTRAGAVDRLARSRRGAAAGLAGDLAAGRGPVPDGLPGRPQRRRLGRDRRRLRQRRRRRPDHSRGTDLRQLPRRRLAGGHLRPGQLSRLRPLRADLALVRQLGRPPRRPRRRRHLRHRHLPPPDPARRSASAPDRPAAAWPRSSPSAGPPTPTPPSPSSPTPTTPSWRCSWSPPCSSLGDR